MLHTVNKSPGESDKLITCLRFTQEGDAVLLIENAVYAALADSEFARHLEGASSATSFYALTPDLAARGLLNKGINPDIRLIDYSGFVRLVTENNIVQSW